MEEIRDAYAAWYQAEGGMAEDNPPTAINVEIPDKKVSRENATGKPSIY